MRHWFAYHPRFFTLTVVLLGSLATAGSFWIARQHAKETLEADARSRVAIRQSALRESLASYEDTVRALAMLFSASDEVDRSEFAIATEGLLQRRPGVRALQWVPVVHGSMRAHEERKASTELGVPYRFQQRLPDGDLADASEREEYWPILYTQPLAGNERALGLDLSTGPTRATLLRARETGRLQVTPRFDLVQTEDDDPGIVAAVPVFRNGEFTGWVQGVFRIREMLFAASLMPGLRALDLTFFDLTVPEDSPAHHLHTEMAGTAADPARPWQGRRSAWRSEFTLQFGDQLWKVVALPSAEWVAQRRSPLMWIVLAGGILVTTLAALITDLLARRAQWGRRLVAERTLELAESRRRLQEILDFSPVPIFVKDLDLRYVQANREFARLVGLEVDEILGRTNADLFPPDQAALLLEHDRKALAAKTVIQYEVQLNRAGRDIWCMSHKFPITDGRGHVIGLCGITPDISGLKQAEAGRIQAERSLQVRQRLDGLAVLAGGIAHDLNNVLAPIVLTVDVLHSITEDEASRELLDSINQSARRGAALVRQVLAFARGGEGNRESVNLCEMVADLARHARDVAAPNLTVTCAHPETELRTSADSDQLHRALLNLVVNARDAMPNGGKLHLEVDTLVVDSLFTSSMPDLQEGRYHTITITDSGQGIPPEVRERIFEPFFTTKAPGRGTGLGLAMVDAIMRAHHGSITVYSELNHGTTFRLYLRAEEASASAPAVREAPPARGNGQSILVVDDEAPIRAATQRILEGAGYRVLTAAHGHEALEIHAAHPEVALVLTDLVMEGMDGAELIEELAKEAPNLPTLVTSGFPATDRVAKALQMRRWRFLPKPATANQLLRAIAETLNPKE